MQNDLLLFESIDPLPENPLSGWIFSEDGSVQPKCLHQSFLLLPIWGDFWEQVALRLASSLCNSTIRRSQKLKTCISTITPSSHSGRDENIPCHEASSKTPSVFWDGVTPYTDTNACILNIPIQGTLWIIQNDFRWQNCWSPALNILRFGMK